MESPEIRQTALPIRTDTLAERGRDGRASKLRGPTTRCLSNVQQSTVLRSTRIPAVRLDRMSSIGRFGGGRRIVRRGLASVIGRGQSGRGGIGRLDTRRCSPSVKLDVASNSRRNCASCHEQVRTGGLLPNTQRNSPAAGQRLLSSGNDFP